MRKTTYRWFWAWEYEKEEKWLNEMAAKGQALVAVSYCRYTFEECLPGEYNIRLELLNQLPSNISSTDYIKFLEETGAEYLGSVIRWVYFRKKSDYGPFDLFSDNSSRITHLNRMLALIFVLLLSLLFFCINNTMIYFTYKDNISLILFAMGLCFDIFVLWGVMRLLKKRNILKKEQKLFE